MIRGLAKDVFYFYFLEVSVFYKKTDWKVEKSKIKVDKTTLICRENEVFRISRFEQKHGGDGRVLSQLHRYQLFVFRSKLVCSMCQDLWASYGPYKWQRTPLIILAVENYRCRFFCNFCFNSCFSLSYSIVGIFTIYVLVMTCGGIVQVF